VTGRLRDIVMTDVDGSWLALWWLWPGVGI
jgi:hypothetical protein